MGVLFESIVGTLLALADQTLPPKAKEDIKPEAPLAPTSTAAGDPALAPTKSKEQAEVKEARVAPFWQGLMVDRMNRGGYDEGWGVFSYGGWSDTGQMILLRKKNSPHQNLIIVGKQNSQEVLFEKKLSPKALNALILELSVIKKLEDVDLPMFDGLVYEMVYVHGQSAANQPKETLIKRVYYKNPGTKQKFKDHDKVLEVADKLKQKTD